MTITVLEVQGVPAVSEGAASARRFLDADTVDARLVEGIAYELPAGERFVLDPDVDRHQLLYVVVGRLSGRFRGREHELAPGRGIYCEPGEGCSVENTGDGPASFYRFFVTPS